MRNMSFMLTTKQMYDETKSVTRRVGWWNLNSGDVVMAVEKGMGLKKGEKVIPIYPILIINRPMKQELARLLRCDSYAYREVIKEGFPDLSPKQFVDMFCSSHKGCTPNTLVNRIPFARHVAWTE